MAVLRRKNINTVDDIKNADLSNPESVVALAKNLGVITKPFDLESFIPQMGILLKKEILDNEISGMLSKNNDNEWEIVVNALHHQRRQRFTLAHELGHYFLHRHRHSSFTDKTLFRSNVVTTIEFEANNFAGALLMPKNDLAPFLSSASIDINNIADVFGVSVLAAKVRIEMIKRNIYEH